MLNYAAYGMNTNRAQMTMRCPTAIFLGVGTLAGYRLTFNNFASVIEDPNSHMEVVMWGLMPSDESALDVLEGYPHFYRKATVMVEMPDGSHESAMIYIMNQSMPSDSYLNIVEEGYRDNGMSLLALDKALDDCWSGDTATDNEEMACSTHPDASHGYCRNASHNAGRYVCECERDGFATKDLTST